MPTIPNFKLIVTVAGIIIIMILMLRFVWYEHLGEIALMITIVSLAMSPIIYFAKGYYNASNERRRASKNLYVELDDTMGALDSDKLGEDFVMVEIGNNKFQFMNRFFNHDFYDSLINSGKIGFLRSDILQRLQDVFQIIKDHNRHIEIIRSLESQAANKEEFFSKAVPYYAILQDHEERLGKDIRVVQEKLMREFSL